MARPRKITPMPTENEQPAREQVEAPQETAAPKTERRTRVPLGTATQKLLASKRPGYVRHWFNDVGGRIPAALQAGYFFVSKSGDEVAESTDMGTAVSRVVGTKEGGGQMVAYLMEIREDWYNEDQAKKQEAVDAVEAEIRKGELQGPMNLDGRYLPKRGITMKTIS